MFFLFQIKLYFNVVTNKRQTNKEKVPCMKKVLC